MTSKVRVPSSEDDEGNKKDKSIKQDDKGIKEKGKERNPKKNLT